MSDNSNPVPRGVVNSGAAVVFGPTTDGLGALRYLQRTDALRQAHQARAQAEAQKQKQVQDKALLTNTRLNPEAGVHYVPALQQRANQTHDEMKKIAADQTRPWSERMVDIQRLRNDYDAEAHASVLNDKLIADEVTRHHTDDRYDAAATSQRLTDTLYKKAPDGSLVVGADGKPEMVPARDWDPRAASAAISSGNAHINTPALFKNFVDTLPDDSVTYSQQPLPGGRGRRSVAKSNVFEINDDGTFKLDPKTGQRVLKNSVEMLHAFQKDPLQKQWLDAEDAKHEQQLAGVIAKMQANEPLTEEEQRTVATEQSVNGRKLELVTRGLMLHGYGRQQTDLLAKAAPRPPAAKRAQGPKFARVGGTEFGTEAIGGTAVGGTHGPLALASSDPLERVKADGTHQPFGGRYVHRQYVLLQNGQPGGLVTNNVTPQDWNYIKPQLHLTTTEGNVVSPPDPTLEQQFRRGDRRPLLDWLRAQQEEHPGYKMQWHMFSVPSKDKLTTQNQTQHIYQRLLTERKQAHLELGQAGYHSDDDLLNKAQKLAAQQGGAALIPYTGPNNSKNDIDRGTDFMLRDPKHVKAMQAEMDYFTRETAPRPAEQRAAPKKSLGINFGTKAPAAAPAATTPSEPNFKRAGTKKTGIKF